MKTPLEQLIKKIEENINERSGMTMKELMPWAIMHTEATILLETELGEILEAHFEGGYNTNGSYKEANQYFKKRYDK